MNTAMLENPMVSGANRPQPGQGRRRSDVTQNAIEAAAKIDAAETACRHVEAIGEWLRSEVYQKPVQPWMPRLNWIDEFDAERADTPALVAVLFDVGQPTRAVIAARDALRRRFLAAHGDLVVDLEAQYIAAHQEGGDE